MDKVSVFEKIVNLSNDFITLIDRNYRYVMANDTYCQEVQKPREQVVGRTVAEVWGEERFRCPIKGFLDRCFAGEEVNNIDKFKFGPFMKYMHVTYFPYATNGDVTHALVFSHDITNIGEIESRLTNYEYRDPVTGLFNRRSLGVILEKEIEKAKVSRRREARAVLILGLHDVETVTQLHGYEISDLLLENTGLRFRTSLRPNDYAFRFDGNELAAVLTDIPDRTQLAALANSIHTEVSTPYRFHDMDISLGCSIGISVYPDDGEDAGTVTRNALTAMTEARRRGEPFSIFDPRLHETANQQLRLQGELSNAFRDNELFLEYQPMVSREGNIVGAEALIRWRHPSRGLLMPAEFIPLATRSGLIDKVGRWVVFNACEQAKLWSERCDIFVSVNLSASEFRGLHLVDNLETAMKRAGNLAPDRLRLEITETESMIDPQATIERMCELRDLGLEVFVDDFGTGHSSLSYLKELPATALKIDKSFIQDVERLEEERRFVRSLVEIIKIRGKKVILEGVSSPAQADLSRTMPCDLMQGFLFSPPVPAVEFDKLLDGDHGR